MTIDLLVHEGQTRVECVALAEEEFALLDKPTYRLGVSVRPITSEDADAPFRSNKTARARARRAETFGHRVTHIEPADHYDDFLRINRSLPERQGRAMDDSYVNLKRQTGRIGDPLCPLHHRLVYGVVNSFGKVVAYASIIRCGDLVHISQFLGHGTYLNEGVMYLLAEAIIREQARFGEGVLFYNRHDSGSDGLRWYKERIGLAKGNVEWTLGT